MIQRSSLMRSMTALIAPKWCRNLAEMHLMANREIRRDMRRPPKDRCARNPCWFGSTAFNRDQLHGCGKAAFHSEL